MQSVAYPDGSSVSYQYDGFRRKVQRVQKFYDVSNSPGDKGNQDQGNGNDQSRGNGQGNGNGHGNGHPASLAPLQFDSVNGKGQGQANGNGQGKGNTSASDSSTDTKPTLQTDTTNYYYDGSDVFKEYGANGEPLTQYYSANGQVIAQQMFGFHNRKQDGYQGNIRTRGGLMYYQYDGLGNVMDVTDRIGSNVMSYRYDAFGNLFTQMAAPYNAVGYTGKTYDAKASLMDYSASWYSPNVGRFTTSDTYEGNATSPQTLNRYAYVGNNPVNFVDPTGHVGVNYSGMPQIQIGDTGTAVTTLQKDLNMLDSAGLKVDGDFGPMTQAAVLNFQRESKIHIDGIVGSQTWGALEYAMNLYYKTDSGNGDAGNGDAGNDDPGNAPTRSAQFNQTAGVPPTISSGYQGGTAALLQFVLNALTSSYLVIDGAFGAETTAAVKAFQSQHGLVADGIVGPKTWTALGNALANAPSQVDYSNRFHMLDAPPSAPSDAERQLEYQMGFSDGLANNVNQWIQTPDYLRGVQGAQQVRDYENSFVPGGGIVKIARALTAAEDAAVAASRAAKAAENVGTISGLLSKSGYDAAQIKQVAEAFGPAAKVVTLTHDVKVYRYYGGAADARGRWVTTSLLNDPVNELALPPGSTADKVAEWIIPKGTQVVEGTVAPNFGRPGGAVQIFLPDSSVLKVR